MKQDYQLRVLTWYEVADLRMEKKACNSIFETQKESCKESGMMAVLHKGHF